MAANLQYDTTELQGVIETIKPLNTFWLDLCFPTAKNFTTEYIDFDVVAGGRRLAPFVAPTVQGKVMKDKGFTTKRFSPAYVKPKMAFDPNRALKRRPGEPYTGTMSPQARRDAIVADMLRDQMEMHVRRREWMAAQAVLTGKVTVSGDDYPTQVVDFGRAANQQIVLAGGATWDAANDATVNALENLETWAGLIAESSGAAPTVLIMGVTVWNVFRKKSYVKDALDTNYAGAKATLDIFQPTNGEAIQFRGTIGPWSVYTYNDLYQDDTGANVSLMDQKSIALLSPAGLQGVRCFGAILDPSAGYQAVEVHPSNWVENDPAGEFFMTQSAPLMVVAQPNAAVVAKVLA
jgi:hypothetical protein